MTIRAFGRWIAPLAMALAAVPAQADELPLEAAFEPLVLTLRHSAFDLDRAKDFAELLEAEFPAVAHDEPALGELLERHRQELARLQPPRPERCAFVHAWPPGAGDRAVCQCGRITKGLARERGLAVLA